MASAGSVYCLPYSGNSVPTSVNAVIAGGTRVIISSPFAVGSARFDTLLPSSVYRLYCAASSASGNGQWTLLEEMLSSKREVRTACCREVTVSLMVDSHIAGTALLNRISVTVDAAPSSPLQLHLAVTRDNITAVNADSFFYPSKVMLTTASWSSAHFVSILPAEVGTYALHASLSGSDSSRYAVKFSNSKSIVRLLPSSSEPETPFVAAATFGSSGKQITVTFSSRVDRAHLPVIFPCKSLFTFVDADTSLCTWQDDVSVVISLGKVAKAIPSDSLSVLPGVLRAACLTSAAVCSKWQTVSNTAVSVSPPALPLNPVVTISAPVTVSVCDSPVIDLSTSSGSGGRDWSKIVISVSCDNATLAARLASFFNDRYSLSRPSPLPAGMLQSGRAYTFTASLCNFLGQCGQASHVMSVSAVASPVVTIQGAQHVVIDANSPFSVKAAAFVSQCDGSVSSSDLAYSWTVSKVASGEVTQIKSVSQNPAMFRLNSRSLQASTTYQIRVQVTSLALLTTSAASVIVSVSAPAVAALIMGGAEQSVGITRPLVLDARGSYYTDGSSLDDVNFTWSCKQTYPTLSACPSTLRIEEIRNGRMLSITPSAETTLDSVYVFTVMLLGAHAVQSSSASVQVTAVAPTDPIISVSLKGRDISSKMNPSDSVVLEGGIIVNDRITSTWSISADSSVDLMSCALTPTSQVLSVGRNIVNLVLKKNCLPGRSVPYTFSLSSGRSYSSIPVIVNIPPLPGTFEVSPKNGTAVSTKFLFLASKWYDDDLPLSYAFGYYSDSDGKALIVQDLSESTYGYSFLPAGSSAVNHDVTCYVKVLDSLGEYAHAMASAKVLSGGLSLAELQSLANDTFTASEGSTDGVKSAIALYSTTVNGADCVESEECRRKAEMRDELMQQLVRLSEVDDVSASSISTWTTALTAVTFKADEMTEHAAETALSLCSAIEEQGSSLGVSTDIYSGVFDSLNSVAIVLASNNNSAGVGRRRLSSAAESIESVLMSLGSSTARDMVSGQVNINVVLPSFQVTSTASLFSPDSALHISLGSPDESSDGNNSHTTAVSIEVASGEVDATAVIKAVLLSVTSSLYESSLTTNPVALKLENNSLLRRGGKITFALQNSDVIVYDSFVNNNMHNTSCDEGEYSIHTYECIGGPNGNMTSNITHECTGSAEVFSSKCPDVALEPSCVLLKGSMLGLSCAVQSFTFRETICECTIVDASTAHRLLSGDDQSDIIQMSTASTYVLKEIGTTLRDTQVTSLSDLQNAVVVIFLYGALWISGFLVIVLVSTRKAYFSLPSVVERKQSLRSRNKSSMVGGSSSLSKERVVKRLMNYIDEVFPGVYQSKSWLTRLGKELSKHHRYLALFTASATPEGEHKRLITCVHLLTIQTMLMFLLAAMYDLQVC